MDTTDIAARMKKYEHVNRHFLISRTPVIIRLDGKAFHTWTKQLKNFDESMKIEPYSAGL